ncbi:MAG: nucleotidyltransferase domain-containing protein [Spirochaetales bacterium]|nr:nucleotidyltransferase domain-containing protein [Spirochaetales bacterium]
MEIYQRYLERLKQEVLLFAEGVEGDIFLYGSGARKEEKADSDIDLGFDHMTKENFRDLERKILSFWEESSIPYDLDLVYFPQASKRFKEIAEQDKILWKQS